MKGSFIEPERLFFQTQIIITKFQPKLNRESLGFKNLLIPDIN